MSNLQSFLSCGRKVQFSSVKAANRRAKQIHNQSGTKLKAYPCHVCKGAHLYNPQKNHQH